MLASSEVLVLVVIVSIALQLVTALLALRLMTITPKRLAWGLISTGLVLMALRRSLSLYVLLATTPAKQLDPTSEYVALTISIILLTGVSMIKPIFQAEGRAEMAEKENAALMSYLLNESPVAVMVHAEDGQIVLVNKAFTESIGYTAEELKTMDGWFRHLKDVEVDELLEKRSKRFDTNGPVGIGEFTVKTKHKGETVWEACSSPFGILPDGRKIVITSAIEITHRKQFESALVESNKMLSQAFEGLIDALVVTIEARDPYTAMHQRHVVKLSQAIVAELGWSEQDTDMLRMTAKIFDIGKIFVPSEILSKPGAVSDVERQMINEHPAGGRDILRDIPYMAGVAKVIYQHHERIDGTGYPEGIKEDEIAPEAKVIGVADVACAIMEHRPYRQAMTATDAAAELKKQRGKAFDPEIVDATCKIITAKGFVLS